LNTKVQIKMAEQLHYCKAFRELKLQLIHYVLDIIWNA
jgi:hypothetical protein